MVPTGSRRFWLLAGARKTSEMRRLALLHAYLANWVDCARFNDGEVENQC